MRTTLRTGRGWAIGIVIAGALLMLLGPLVAAGSHGGCTRGAAEETCAAPPVGPHGEAVRDRFFFLSRRLDGDGSITVRVGPMTGRIREMPPAGNTGADPGLVPGVEPWAKAGVMIKRGIEPGAAYTAVMTTAGHGVRMQHNFSRDTAGTASNSWLRLTRAGRTITGYDSPDGRQWTRIDTADLDGPARIGLFAASPGHLSLDRASGSSGVITSFTEVTAVVGQVVLQGADGDWSRDDIGIQYEPNGSPHHPGGAVQSGDDAFALTGVGDIAPLVDGPRIEDALTGLIPALIVLIVAAVLCTPTGYPRILMRKAAVMAGTAGLTGLTSAAVAVFAGTRLREANGFDVLPVSVLTGCRVVIGAAALCGAVTVLAVAIGALFRRRLVATAVAVAVIVLPYVLATALLVPDAAEQWVFRLTPAAGFAVLQSIPRYPQMLGNFVPSAGFYPLRPWAGLAVLGCYTAFAFGLAVRRTGRRAG